MSDFAALMLPPEMQPPLLEEKSMPKKSKKSNGKVGGIPAFFITLALSLSAQLLGHSEKGDLGSQPLVNVTVNNVNVYNNTTIINNGSER